MRKFIATVDSHAIQLTKASVFKPSSCVSITDLWLLNKFKHHCWHHFNSITILTPQREKSSCVTVLSFYWKWWEFQHDFYVNTKILSIMNWKQNVSHQPNIMFSGDLGHFQQNSDLYPAVKTRCDSSMFHHPFLFYILPFLSPPFLPS